MNMINHWTIGEWQFFQVDGAEIHNSYAGRELFGYAPVDTEPSSGREGFNSLDHVMVAAIAEKYTGPRGAGGTGVGTAADWFMRMIGADQVVPVDHQSGQKALAEAIEEADGFPPVGPMGFASRVSTQLERRGLVLAALNHGK
jgi:hypothetical protein